MTPQEFLDEFGTLTESADGVPKLRELILQLAGSGRLVDHAVTGPNWHQGVFEQRDATIAELRIRRHPETPEIEPVELPFPVPSGWLALRLGDITYSCPTSYGENPSPDMITKGVVKVGNIANNGGFKGHFSERGFPADKLDGFIARAGDIVVVKSSGSADNVHSGKAALCRAEHDGKIVGSNFVIRLRGFGDAVDPEFLWRILISRTTRAWIEQTVQTMTYPNLKWSDYSQLPLAIPPLAEQHRIVSKVDELMGLCDRLEAVQGERRGVRVRLNRSSLDRLTSVSGVGARQRGSGLSAAWQRVCDHFEVLYDTPETLPDLRQTILQLAVQGKLVPQNPNDEPAEELLQRTFAEKRSLEESGAIKTQPGTEPITDDEILFPIPESWAWVRANEVSYPISSGTTPPKTIFQDDPTGGIPYLKVYNIRNQAIDFAYKPQYIDAEYHATKMKRCVLVPGMVVLNIVGPPLGKTAIIPDDFPEWNCNQAIAFFRFIGDVQNTYVHQYLKAGCFLRDIALIGTAGQDNISVTKCKNIVIPIPPFSEQKRIVSKVTHLLSQVTRLESTLTRRESTRTQLLTAAIHSILEPDA